MGEIRGKGSGGTFLERLAAIPPAPGVIMDTVAGINGSRSVLTTLDEVRTASVTVAATARRNLSIYTPDLEPQIYDTHAFLEVVKRLVLARSYARVRVLIGEPTRTIREGNRFLAMGRRLTSYIDLRNVHIDYRNYASAFLIADDRALVYRLQSSRWDGIVELNDTAVARKYLSYFDEVWQASEPEPEVRMMRG
jgi:hypothetical protein